MISVIITTRHTTAHGEGSRMEGHRITKKVTLTLNVGRTPKEGKVEKNKGSFRHSGVSRGILCFHIQEVRLGDRNGLADGYY